MIRRTLLSSSRDPCSRSVLFDWLTSTCPSFSPRPRCRFKHVYPPLDESELKESFVRSGGPGGQNVNKLETCVQLIHLPTKIVVKCQEQRTQEQNRLRAREIMQERLDLHFNGEESYIRRRTREHLAREAAKHAKSKAKLELKRQFKQNHFEIVSNGESSKETSVKSTQQ
ncbi:hypothetical protein RvY_09377 [Ramazzottius varieornatus]|uniref:Prokaryotic-type class I peptide chain release factors domain-containing protein n=1 Tax=Ramazzottius varieornatus TaxID=947166 RepID=A0A1D1V949_RAMVA|nr:hypothetical protein RvY_09377 [Ramazzottius varieornatus]